MNCLLDTHVFLWAVFSPKRLSRPACRALSDPENAIRVSVVTLWEISLKYALGKIELEGVSPENMPEVIRRSGFELLPVDAEDAATFHRLPRECHKDPFDRMLVHQAIRQRHTLVTADSALEEYVSCGLTVLW